MSYIAEHFPEAFQAVVWPALVSEPKMKISEPKWESVH